MFAAAGIAPEGDRQMFQEMHHQSRHQSGQLRPEVCLLVHGQIHGLLQPSVQGLHQEAAADEMKSAIAIVALLLLPQSAWIHSVNCLCRCSIISCNICLASD